MSVEMLIISSLLQFPKENRVGIKCGFYSTADDQPSEKQQTQLVSYVISKEEYNATTITLYLLYLQPNVVNFDSMKKK